MNSFERDSVEEEEFAERPPNSDIADPEELLLSSAESLFHKPIGLSLIFALNSFLILMESSVL
jgi:hypothetical protein